MNDDNNNGYEEQEPDIMDEAPLLSDRDIPQGARTSNNKIIGGVLMGLLASAAIGALAYNELTNPKHQPKSAIEEIEFRAPKPMHEPYIANNAPTPNRELNSPSSELTDNQILELKHKIAMQEEAMKLAKEEQEKLEKRLRAPMVVYDQPTKKRAQNYQEQQNPYNGNGSGAIAFSGNGVNSNDPNQAFANEQRNKGYETASATQLRNLNTLITQGEMISGILETAIQSDLPGMVRAIVSENIYSFEGSNLLIPKGTRLVGQYRSGIKKGQSRVFIIWNRLIRPDGASINIGSIGTDTLGRSGLGGDVDSHFMERFGSSILLSIINGGLSAAVDAIDNDSASNVSLSGSDNFSRSSEIALENSIDIKPTIHIDQGERIKIFVSKDLDFKDVGAFQID